MVSAFAMYTKLFLVSGHSETDFCGGKCQQLSSGSAELSLSSSEREGRTKKSGIIWDWTIICSTTLEPVLLAVELLVRNLHSAFWTCLSKCKFQKLFPPRISLLSPGVLLHMGLWPLCGLARLIAHWIPNSAPCKPGFYKNHPQGVFPCGIINKYICFRSVVWMLNFPLFLLSLIPQNLWLKGQRSPMYPHKDPIYSHAVLQSIGSISYNYRWEYVCWSNKWMDIGAIFSRSLKLLRNKIHINFCFDGNWNFYLKRSMFLFFWRHKLIEN